MPTFKTTLDFNGFQLKQEITVPFTNTAPKPPLYEFVCARCGQTSYTTKYVYAERGVCFHCAFPKYCECGAGIPNVKYDQCYNCATSNRRIIRVG